jgi:hypothetical protein
MPPPENPPVPPPPPPSPPSSQRIPDAWANNAHRLTAWAEGLIVQGDGFGQYLPIEKRTKEKKSFTNKNTLTPSIIRRHFVGRYVADLIGVHSTVRDEKGCWSIMLVCDIDRHEESVDPAITLKTALTWYERAHKYGLNPLLIDSNGVGGYHLFVIFDDEIETPLVYQLGQWLFHDWKDLGLSEKPETFPKQSEIDPGRWGNWIRLPGRHHTRDHWSKVWDGHQWLEGIDAIEWLLQAKRNPTNTIPDDVYQLVLSATTGNNGPKKTSGTLLPEKKVEVTRLALKHISNNDLHYDDWFKVGMCLAQLGEDGRQLFHEWSATSKKYDQQTTDQKFDSFKPASELEKGKGLSLGSLFKMAKDGGFKFPPGVFSTTGNLDSDPRPKIEITTERKEVRTATLDAITNHPELYRRGFLLVNVIQETRDEIKLTPKTTMKGVADSPRIIVLSDSNIGCEITESAVFTAWQKKGKDKPKLVRVHPPGWLIAAVATSQHYPGMRVLRGVMECPFFRSDGTLVEQPGYDEATETFLAPGTCEFLPVPEFPTKDDAWESANRLFLLIDDFPILDEEKDKNKAAWLAGLLTPLARAAINGPVPGLAVRGNRAGVGKGLLINLIGTIVTGRNVPTSDYPVEPEEAQKVKVSILLEGPLLTHFDNVEEGGSYGNSKLDSALTSTTINDRILGGNRRTGDIRWRTCCFLSGNNIAPYGDADRRWLVCNLTTKLERPHERKDFQIVNLQTHVEQNRAELLRDALTILRAHFVAGQPTGNWARFGSFEAWDSCIRGAIWFATGVDCCSTQREAADESPKRLKQIALMEGWWELKDGEEGVTVKKAIEMVTESPGRYPTLHNVFMELGFKGQLADSDLIGKKLRSMKNVVIDDMCFKEAGESHRAKMWRVEISQQKRDQLRKQKEDEEAQQKMIDQENGEYLAEKLCYADLSSENGQDRGDQKGTSVQTL